MDGIYASINAADGRRVCLVDRQTADLWWIQESSLAARGPEDALSRGLADDLVLSATDTRRYLDEGGFVPLDDPLASDIRTTLFPKPEI